MPRQRPASGGKNPDYITLGLHLVYKTQVRCSIGRYARERDCQVCRLRTTWCELYRGHTPSDYSSIELPGPSDDSASSQHEMLLQRYQQVQCWEVSVVHVSYKKYPVSSVRIHLLSNVSISIIDTFEVYQYHKSLMHQCWYICCRKSRKTFHFRASRCAL